VCVRARAILGPTLKVIRYALPLSHHCSVFPPFRELFDCPSYDKCYPDCCPGTKGDWRLERGPLSLARTIEELLGRKSSGSGLEIREYGRRDPSL
jgi:hypothetical protein